MTRWFKVITEPLTSILYKYWLIFLFFRNLKTLIQWIFCFVILDGGIYVNASYWNNPTYKTVSIILTIGHFWMALWGNYIGDKFLHEANSCLLLFNQLVLVLGCFPILIFSGIVDGAVIPVFNPTFQWIEQIISFFLFILYSSEIWTFLIHSFWLAQPDLRIQKQRRSGTVSFNNPIPD